MNNENDTTSAKSKKVKYILAAIAAIAVIAVIIIVVCASGGKGTKTESTAPSETASSSSVQSDSAPADTKVYTPTFMYFVSKNDEGYTDYMKITEELESEYNGRVKFDIVDIDEDPSAKENFPVDETTSPMLIMTNTKNDISAIVPKCTDKETLKQHIETSLEN